MHPKAARISAPCGFSKSVRRPSIRQIALCNATLPYIHRLAELGTEEAFKVEAHATGLNVHGGKIVHPVVELALNGSDENVQQF